MGSDVVADGNLVRGTHPQPLDQTGGAGIMSQLSCATNALCDPSIRSILSVTGSTVEQSYAGGILSGGSDLELMGVLVRETLGLPTHDVLGDGVVISAESAEASANITGTRIARSARAGVANFAARASLHRVSVECNSFALNGEGQFTIEDGGENTCGCDGSVQACKVVSAGLQAPAPIAPPGE